jgi:hypothetical protein
LKPGSYKLFRRLKIIVKRIRRAMIITRGSINNGKQAEEMEQLHGI